MNYTLSRGKEIDFGFAKGKGVLFFQLLYVKDAFLINCQQRERYAMTFH